MSTQKSKQIAVPSKKRKARPDQEINWATYYPLIHTDVEPRWYQKQVAELFSGPNVDRFSVSHPPGSGKTKTGVLCAECSLKFYIMNGVTDIKVVIICPPDLRRNFFNALIEHGCSVFHIK